MLLKYLFVSVKVYGVFLYLLKCLVTSLSKYFYTLIRVPNTYANQESGVLLANGEYNNYDSHTPMSSPPSFSVPI